MVAAPDFEPTLSVIDGVPAARLAAVDRGLLYGDGVFRTLRVEAGRPRWWGDHLDRLRDDAARLDIPFPSEAVWRADLADLPARDGVLRLTVTRGQGPRGYAPSSKTVPTRVAQFFAQALPGFNSEGAHLRLCRLRLAAQPALAGVKHLNRLENILARAEWDDPGIAEGLLCDMDRHLIGGVSSNLFLLRGDALATPRLDRCGVAGVTRARLMQRADRLGLQACEATLSLNDLDTADALFYVNSVQGLRWVAEMDRWRWPAPPVFPALAEALWAD